MMMNKDMLFHHHQHQQQQTQQQQQQQQQVIAEENMSNLTSASGDQTSVSSGNRTEASGSNFVNPQQQQQQYFVPQSQAQSSQTPKKKRNQPGNPDPEAEVVALSPKTLMATNRFICEICSKGFQRDQNLQLHRRGHNLPWKLKQRSKTQVMRKKVYVCPEASCVHHSPSRALGDLTGIKKHFCRKHGDKKWKCDKCSKRYAVQSDWKAHSKTCGTKQYTCDCGTLFSRRDSFITHRAFCDALAEESARAIPTTHQPNPLVIQSSPHHQTQPNHDHNHNHNASSSSHNLVNLHVQNLDNYVTHHHNSSNSSSSTSTSTTTNNNNNNDNDVDVLHAFSIKKEQHSDVNHTFRPQYHQLVSPWLAPPPGPGPASPPSVFSHQCDLTSPNPTPSGGGFFPFGSSTAFHHPSPPSPAMSATALLQKAAQMGATKTTAPSPADEIRPPPPPSSSHSLTTTMAAMMTSSAPPPAFNHPCMFQDYTMSSAAGFDRGVAFDESFGGFLRTSGAAAVATEAVAPVSGERNDGGGGEGLTRDFLGLKQLSHSDILSFAGLGDCINSNASEQQHQHSHSQKPWQG